MHEIKGLRVAPNASPKAQPSNPAPLYDIGKVNPYPVPQANPASPTPGGSSDDFISDMGYMLLGAIMGIVGTLIYYQIARLHQRFIANRSSNPNSLSFLGNPNNYI